MKPEFDLSFSLFAPYPRLLIALSTKAGGSCRLRSLGKPDGEIIRNRETFLHSLGISPYSLASALLAQRIEVFPIRERDAGKIIHGVDGLVTDKKGMFLSITVADCLPLFIYDPKKEIVGLVHAGWRGLEAEIIKKAVTTFEQVYGSDPQTLLAGIGPGIGPCHFEIQDDVVRKFSSYPEALEERGGKRYLDLKAIAASQFRKSGLDPRRIEIHPACTFCEDALYFSHRRDKTNPPHTMMAIAGILP